MTSKTWKIYYKLNKKNKKNMKQDCKFKNQWKNY